MKKAAMLLKRVKEDAYMKKRTIFKNSWNLSNWKPVESWSSHLWRVDETPGHPFWEMREASCWLAVLWVPEEVGPVGVVPRERRQTGSDDLWSMLMFYVSTLSSRQITGWTWVVFQELSADSYDDLTFLGASFRQGWTKTLGVVPKCLRAELDLFCWTMALFPISSSI